MSDNENKESEAVKAASFFSTAWPKIRDLLIKTVLVRWIPKAIGGVWGWLAVVVIDWIARPVYDYTIRKVIVAVRKIGHNKKGTELEQSKTETEFDSSSDSLP
jgi:hypothetical protein